MSESIYRLNPRYVAYSSAHGRTPDDMLAHDIERYPGGKMAGFIVWMHARWSEWRAARGRSDRDSLSLADHTDFDAWLSERVAAPLFDEAAS